MKIDFFEEFPTKKNLSKLKFINFNSTIYIAARSFTEFKNLKKKIRKINSGVGYWPILERSYWISPFSYTFELRKLYKDIKKNQGRKNLKILLDLELPFLNRKLFFFNAFSFLKNKNLIKRIFVNAKKINIDILTAEYTSSSRFAHKILDLFGISYSLERFPHKKIIMFYSSMKKDKNNYIKGYIKKQSKKFGDKIQIGLGTIAHGILGNEMILSPSELKNDLDFCMRQKINTVVIFRLGGLNKDYLKIIKKYLKK